MANILDGKYVSKNFKVYGTSAVFEISHNRQETGLLIGICKTHAILSPFKDPTLASDQKHLFEICFLHHSNVVYLLRSSLFKQLK